MKKLSIVAASIIGVLGLSACSSSHSPEVQDAFTRINEKLKGGFEERVKTIEMKRQSIGQIKHGPAYHDINNYSLIETDSRRLPTSFDQRAFIKDDEEPFTVDTFSALLYSAYGIVIDVSSPDLQLLAGKKNDNSPTVADPTRRSVNADSASDYEGVIDLIGQGANETDRDDLQLKPFKFKDGTVREMLDYVSILNGLKWKYDNDFKKGYLYVYETREFSVFDFGDKVEQKATISTETSQQADSASGGTQKEVTRESSTDGWKNITESISDMLSPDGSGKASFDRKTGMVVVTDSDYALSKINNYITKMNHISTREVSVQYRIIRFKYDETTNKGVNQNSLNAGLKNNVFGSFDLEFGSGTLSPDISGNLGAFQEIMQGNFLTLANESHELLMGFLNSVGTAELAYENQVPVMNNSIFTHQGGENQEYISSIERSSISSGVGQENVTTKKDIAVDGVNMTLKPRIVGDQIQMKYSVSTSDFIGLTDAGLGAGLEGVKLKNDSSLDIDHSALFQNGVPRIVQFIHESENIASAKGLFDHSFWFFGGNENQSKAKNAVIVTMTVSYNN
jgi:hypothetical protein